MLACLALSATMSSAVEIRFESGSQQTALIELYTSEGCSSCPPAEAWLSRFKGEPGLWKTFVPLAFHVDYWDRLGWPDRFSSKRWTERQRGYVSRWQGESVYTPAVVFNGNEVRHWSGVDLPRPNEKQAGVLSAGTTDGKSFAIEFRPAGGMTAVWEAHAALLGSGISTKIAAGENRGRDLRHDFVVLDLRDAEMKSEGGTMRARLTMNAAGEPGSRKALAVWVSARDQLAPLQATGGWLP